MQAFGDGFDLYAAPTDGGAGYWDSYVTSQSQYTLQPGRFTGSQAFQMAGGSGVAYVKSSGQNDAVHHIVCAFWQNAAISGTTLGFYLQFSDASTNQCCIVFRSDGAVLLTSATPAGTVLATYTGAVTASSTWTAFEFEVVINNTTGSFTVRKNGNVGTPDFQATSLNTRPGTNNYANKLTTGSQGNITSQRVDDLLWRSDPTSVPWVGDIRCYTRMPASDVQKQFTPSSGTTNYSQVSEAHEDGATSYVFDSNVGDADFYSLAALAGTPASTVCVTTRGFFEKSDAGTRNAAVQIKSGSTTVTSASTALATSWGWLWRVDINDPNTSAAWTAVAVNNAQIGPIVTA